MICSGCAVDKSTQTAVIRGQFGVYCKSCISTVDRHSSAASAGHSRQVDREIHAKDLLQPWNLDNTPNREFIRVYPDQAKDMYSREELENYG